MLTLLTTFLVFFLAVSTNAKTILQPENELQRLTNQASTNDLFCNSYDDCINKLPGHNFACNTKLNKCICAMGYDDISTTATSLSCEARHCTLNSTCTGSWGPHSYCYLFTLKPELNMCQCGDDQGESTFFNSQTGLCDQLFYIGPINYWLIFGPLAGGFVVFTIFIIVAVFLVKRRREQMKTAGQVNSRVLAQNPHQNPQPGFNSVYTENPTTSAYPNLST